MIPKILNLTKKRGYSIKAKTNQTAEIYIYEEIGDWFGGVTASSFKDDLKALKNTRIIDVRLNSPGGDVFDGFAIHNLLKQHPATINVYVDGLAASIASVIAMAGNQITIAENALMMIHEPWTFAFGNSTEIRKIAEQLDKISSSIMASYKRASISQEELQQMMEDETWMTAQEAIDMGFADQLVESVEIAAMSFDLSRFNFRNYPTPDLSGQTTDETHKQKLAHMRLISQKIKRSPNK